MSMVDTSFGGVYDPSQAGMAQTAYDPSQSAMGGVLSPQAPSQSPFPTLPTPPPQQSGGGGPLGLLGSLINRYTTGYANDADAARTEMYNRRVAMQMMQAKMQALGQLRGTLPEAEQRVFDADPIGYETALVKNRELQKLAGSESLGSAGGIATTAPLTGLDEKSGQGYSITPSGMSTSNNALGGDFSQGANGIVSGRTGAFQGVSQPAMVPPANTLYPFTPSAGGQAAPAPAGAPPAAPNDLDSLVRMAYGEAANQGAVGQQAVAAVALNRARLAGAPVSSVIGAPGQFEGFNDKARALNPNSAAYRTIAMNLAPLLSGQVQDPTGGATSFYSPTAQAALGRPAPAWATGPNQRIGGHLFYKTAQSPDWAGATTGAPAPASGIGAPLVQGKTNTPISPQEAQSLGLAPGIWARDPMGKPVSVSAAPKGDMERIDTLAANVDSLRALAEEQARFMQHNQHTGTAPIYANPEIHGIGLNPIADLAESVNPDFKSMEASQGRQTLLVKPAGFGPLRVGELPYLKVQAQSTANTGDVNQGIYGDTKDTLAQSQARLSTMKQYIYQHGSLQGFDGSKSSGQAQSRLSPQQAASLAPGTSFVGLDGIARVRH